MVVLIWLFIIALGTLVGMLGLFVFFMLVVLATSPSSGSSNLRKEGVYPAKEAVELVGAVLNVKRWEKGDGYYRVCFQILVSLGRMLKDADSLYCNDHIVLISYQHPDVGEVEKLIAAQSTKCGLFVYAYNPEGFVQASSDAADFLHFGYMQEENLKSVQ